MDNDSELKADKLNSDETQGSVRTPKRGIWSDPIRKRAYHRGLKRGATWALMRKHIHDTMNDLNKQMLMNAVKLSDHYEKNYKLFNGD